MACATAPKYRDYQFKLYHGMKGPTRPAPGVPGVGVSRYSPVTNWNDDPFSADVFEPTPQFVVQKKLPPPRPPPPKANLKQPDAHVKPSHFIRKPTVLSSLLSRKSKTAVANQNVNTTNVRNQPKDFNSELDTNKMFPKCDPKNVQTGTLIDLSSPPSSPTFTTRSSSDGLSVDSFGSDATTSTNNQHIMNGGTASQAESGFEDDFDLFLNTRKVPKDDTFEDITFVDPFSPTPVSKPLLMKKPLSKNLFDVTQSCQAQMPTLKGPTIIRAKPARPKPPDNSALLKNTFGNNFPVTSMVVNTTTPIQKVCNTYEDSFNTKPFETSWEDEVSSDRESSPPMPSIPPPPPPPDVDEERWADKPALPIASSLEDEDSEPHAIAIFDYFTDHPDDLCFSVNTKIYLVRRVNDEWLYGRLRSGSEGLFPSNYVEIKVPLPNEPAPKLKTAVALYDFNSDQPGDLRFYVGDTFTVLNKITEEWWYGELNGAKGQFPSNYVQLS